MDNPTEKLQKVLARAGLGSRRGLEKVIAEGRVEVNGAVAEVGRRVSSTDKIKLDGKPVLSQASQSRMLIYNKPEGEICSRADDKGRPTVFHNLPELTSGRWISIGRLDFNSSGLLLFTNDGELANKLMHPSTNLDREYKVRVFGKLSDDATEKLLAGVMLEDGMANFTTLIDEGGQGSNHWYTVTLTEGRNREVRRLFEFFDCKVSRLLRTRYGSVSLPRDLKAGESRDIPLLTE